MSKAEAFDDFIQELRKTGGDPETLAREIAPEYDLHPDFLMRLYNTRYPDGLPKIDIAKASQMAEAAKRREVENVLAQNQAISDFFKQNPASLPRSSRAAMQIINENESQLKLIAGVKKALEGWGGARYADRNGKEYRAGRLADVKSEMISNGWKNVSRLDESDLENLGFQIIEGTYTQGARPTGKWIKVVVLKEVEGA